MTWLKQSDKAHSHPLVLGIALLEPGNPRVVNELFGFVSRCAGASAEHLLDHHVPIGTALHFAMGEGPRLIDLGKRAGLWKEVIWTPNVDEQPPSTFLKLVEDEDLWHMPTRKQVYFERSRKRDRAGLTAARIRFRDGDHCRYCGNWVDAGQKQTTARTLTVDHLTPGEEFTGSSSPDDGVVACQSCNAKLRQKPRAERVKLLKTVPSQPEYTRSTKEFLIEHGLLGRSAYEEQAPSITEPSGPGDGSEGIPTAASGAGDPAVAPAGQPRHDAEPADRSEGPEPDSDDPAVVEPPHGGTTSQEESSPIHGRGIPRPPPRNEHGGGRGSRVGSGRVGSGQAGPGQDVPDPDGPQRGHSQEQKRRHRRRGRKR